MIGSEGTLGFIAELSLHTIAVAPVRATGLYVFADAKTACAQIPHLQAQGAEAVELMDSRALQRVTGQLALVGQATLDAGSVALLVDISAPSQTQLEAQLEAINAGFPTSHLQTVCAFTQDSQTIDHLWQIRKGLFPAVGAVRAQGTTVIIEDIAFDLTDLAAGLQALKQLFERYDYDEAIVFGHALDGNLHFVFTQQFDTPAQRQRYDAFMQDVVSLVAGRYHGTLKAEHGTGRNMAPFLVHQWGPQAVSIMQRIKQLLDPGAILNPGVIFNADPKAHLQHLKTLPPVDTLIDNCIECGFCEPQCPSSDLTLTPRQRIALMRRLPLLEPDQQATIERQQAYLVDTTCAATGMCATSCPVNIDTGAWVKKRRARDNPQAAETMARHLAATHRVARSSLSVAHWASQVLPVKVLPASTRLARRIWPTLPEYFEELPKGATPVTASSDTFTDKVIYLPSCLNRVFGAADDQPPLPEVVTRVMNKAGFEVVIPRMWSNSAVVSHGATKAIKKPPVVMNSSSKNGCNSITLRGAGRSSLMPAHVPNTVSKAAPKTTRIRSRSLPPLWCSMCLNGLRFVPSNSPLCCIPPAAVSGWMAVSTYGRWPGYCVLR
nr:FAD-linked oxidase C-terminal domain-containing protein [Salinimonas marina]